MGRALVRDQFHDDWDFQRKCSWICAFITFWIPRFFVLANVVSSGFECTSGFRTNVMLVFVHEFLNEFLNKILLTTTIWLCLHQGWYSVGLMQKATGRILRQKMCKNKASFPQRWQRLRLQIHRRKCYSLELGSIHRGSGPVSAVFVILFASCYLQESFCHTIQSSPASFHT